MSAIAVLFAVLACGRDETVPDRPADSLAAVVAAASPASPALPADSLAAEKPECLATGLWSRCAILERLERSGLAPRLDSTPVSEPPLAGQGFRVAMNRGDLEVYIYPDTAARERAQAALDPDRYIHYTASLTMANQSTLIVSGNALAVLRSHNAHLRERVGDALTAGAPARVP